MSRKHDSQDGTGTLDRVPGYGEVQHWASTTPTAGAVGYAKACLWHNVAGSAGTMIYVNVGTATSAVWFPLDGTAVGSLERAEVNTAITTAGAGTLTGAALAGGLITRTGPSAAYTDTTDTAALIIAALPTGTAVGSSWEVSIKNTVAFAATLAAGSGVTLSGQTIIPPNSVGRFLLTYSAAGAVTMVGMNIGPMTTMPLVASTTLNTAGAGSITAASIVGGLLNRTTASSAFTDTTPTGAAIIAALPNGNAGQSWVWTYYNNTAANATLAAGDGNVTITGTGIPANQWAEYLVTMATGTTVTIVQMGMGPCVDLPYSKFTVNTGATLAAGDATGAAVVHYENNASNANVTFRTAAQMFGDIPNCQVGFTYTLMVRNLNATGLTLVAPDGNTTLSGTMTIAQNVTRMLHCQFTAATTMTITSMGIFAAGA